MPDPAFPGASAPPCAPSTRRLLVPGHPKWCPLLLRMRESRAGSERARAAPASHRTARAPCVPWREGRGLAVGNTPGRSFPRSRASPVHTRGQIQSNPMFSAKR
jgi:hypothetical protein